MRDRFPSPSGWSRKRGATRATLVGTSPGVLRGSNSLFRGGWRVS